MHSSNVSGLLWVLPKLSSCFSHFSNAVLTWKQLFFKHYCHKGVFLRTGGQNEWPFSQYFLFLILEFPKFNAATSPAKLVMCSHNCCEEPGDCCCAEPCNANYQIQDSTKGILPVEPLMLKAKSEIQILFLHFHFWLLSKIISNLGLTVVFSATFVQLQPLLSVAYEHSNLHVIHPWPFWFHFKDSSQGI